MVYLGSSTRNRLILGNYIFHGVYPRPHFGGAITYEELKSAFGSETYIIEVNKCYNLNFINTRRTMSYCWENLVCNGRVFY